MSNGEEADGQKAGYFRGDRRRSLLPDPAYLFMVFRRRVWLFAALVVTVLAATAGLVLSMTPTYVATASVLIEPRKTTAIDLQSVAQGLPADTNAVDTQTQIISSPSTALAVVRRLHLDRSPEYLAEKAEQGGDAGQADKLAAGLDHDAKLTPAERQAVSSVLRSVTVRRAGLTYVIEIAARSTSPEKAATVANAFATEYISLQEARRVAVTEEASKFASGRADELRAQAVADDAALQEYMVKNNLMSAQGATMAEQEVSELNQQIAQAQASLAQERGKLAAAQAQITRGGEGADIGAVLASDTVRGLRERETAASAELASLQSRYGQLHPDVQKAQKNLADIRGQLASERTRIASALKANVDIAQSGLSSLEASRGRARSALASNSTAQVTLLDLQRKAEASRAIYSAFLQRAKETAAVSNLPLADASISSLARLPDSPDSPNYRLAALFGLFGAVVLGLVGIAAAEYLDGSISTREQVEHQLGQVYAGSIPDLKSSASRDSRNMPPYHYVLSHPFSAFAEAVRAVGAFTTRQKTGAGRVVAIASALPREGKTSLAISLGRVLAAGGRRVILVDGDLRRHQVSDILFPGDGGEERLLQVLHGDLPVSQALVKDEATDLMVLPTRGLTTTEDFLTAERVERLYAALRQACDVVIVDTAPVLGVVDTRALTRAADVTLVVCRWRHTSLKAVRAALDILQQSSAKVAGVALSVVDIRQFASTGYSESYGYHKKFAGYYVD